MRVYHFPRLYLPVSAVKSSRVCRDLLGRGRPGWLMPSVRRKRKVRSYRRGVWLTKGI